MRDSVSMHAARAECCEEPECRTGLRNNYYVGKRLTQDGFVVEQRFLNGRRRLLNRAIHGWGVVYGFGVDRVAPDRIQIDRGLALDRSGRELVKVEGETIALSNLIALDADGDPPSPHCNEKPPSWTEGTWLLRAHYAERRLDPVGPRDSCGCAHGEQWDHVCETVRFSLQKVDAAVCRDDSRCELSCDCKPACTQPDPGGIQPEGGQHGDQTQSREDESSGRRGGGSCLCTHLTGLTRKLEPPCERWTTIDERCGAVAVDLGDGVPLACVSLVKDGECAWRIEKVDACGPRRLVKRNDLLFDLVQGCDLTRIVDTSWKDCHELDWETFDPLWGGDQSGKTELCVQFSKSVRPATVRRDCIAITVMFPDDGEGWWEAFRVPIVEVRLEPGTLPGSATPVPDSRARVVVDRRWLGDAIRGTRTKFDRHHAFVEIEVRGDLILDCNGQAIDAERVGAAAVPTGNGAPGGRYFSSFRVGRKPKKGDTE